jgi:hypothetical protein
MPMNEQADRALPWTCPAEAFGEGGSLSKCKNPGDGEQSIAPMTPLKTQMPELFIPSFYQFVHST